MRSSITFFSVLVFTRALHACSCFGPDNFCSALDTMWSGPDVVVLAEKISDIHYGMQVRVIDPLAGPTSAGDTLMVWGDHGFLCRVYTASWSTGDTIVLALHNTDFMGNNFPNTNFPPDLEQPGDFHISVCGVYFLGYQNGVVSGEIDGTQTTMPYQSFHAMVEDCSLFTGIEETSVLNISVRQDLINDLLIIEFNEPNTIIGLYDLNGRLLAMLQANSNRSTISTASFPKGILIVRAINDRSVLSKKVWIQ